MRAHSCHWSKWSIIPYAQGCAACAFIFCTVFSSSFGAIFIDSATGRKLQQVARHSQHASRCWERATQRPETVATIIGLQMHPLYERVWFTACHGRSSQTQHVGWNAVCRSKEPQVHVHDSTRWSSRWGSSPTWYPRCVAHTSILLLRKCRNHLSRIVRIVQ